MEYGAYIVAITIFGLVYYVADQMLATFNKRKKVSTLKGKKSLQETEAELSENATKKKLQIANQLEKLERKKDTSQLSFATKLEQLGFKYGVLGFLGLCLVGGIVLFGVGFILGYKPEIAGPVSILLSFSLPVWYINFVTKRRAKLFLEEFTSALDIITRGVKSGLPLQECLYIIEDECTYPLADEFALLNSGMKVGLTLEEALNKMCERIPSAEINFFAISLVIQQKTGGSLSEILTNLSNVLRDRKRLKGKVQALSSEAKASASIIGSLPIFVMGLVYVFSPKYLLPLFETSQGNMMMVGSAVWMSIGIFVMRKMINFI